MFEHVGLIVGLAGDIQKEVHYLQLAGDQALQQFANKDASQIFHTIIKKAATAVRPSMRASDM